MKGTLACSHPLKSLGRWLSSTVPAICLAVLANKWRLLLDDYEDSHF